MHKNKKNSKYSKNNTSKGFYWLESSVIFSLILASLLLGGLFGGVNFFKPSFAAVTPNSTNNLSINNNDILKEDMQTSEVDNNITDNKGGGDSVSETEVSGKSKTLTDLVIESINGSMGQKKLEARKVDNKWELDFNKLEKASNSADRARGLMYRRSLCDACGMLFMFEEERELSFWMDNTYIPLDIIYINEEGKITDIHYGKPLSTVSLASSGPAKYALEINFGLSEKLNIKTGDNINLEHLTKQTSAYEHGRWQ